MKPIDYVSGLNGMYQRQGFPPRDPGNIVDLQYEWDEPFDFPGFLRDMQDMLREEKSTLQEWKPK
jgi:hypothetical protein